MFSNRLPGHAEVNALSRAVASLTAAGTSFVDLTESNPTRAGCRILPICSARRRPTARSVTTRSRSGCRSAREAVAADYARRGAAVDPEASCSSASTSEAYSWLFKLLCNPGESVLIPQPSYPLFEHLTRLEAVRAVPYRLEYHGRWEIDFAVDRCCAGRRPGGAAGVAEQPDRLVCQRRVKREHARRDLPRREGGRLSPTRCLPSTRSMPQAPATEIARARDVLSFTLGGASKSLGLPQMKLAWTIVGGPAQSGSRRCRRSSSSPTPFSRSTRRCKWLRRICSVVARAIRHGDPPARVATNLIARSRRVARLSRLRGAARRRRLVRRGSRAGHTQRGSARARSAAAGARPRAPRLFL